MQHMVLLPQEEEQFAYELWIQSNHITLLTYCFLNLSSTGGEGEPIISWIFATWSSSFDPGNKGRRLHGGEERRGKGEGGE